MDFFYYYYCVRYKLFTFFYLYRDIGLKPFIYKERGFLVILCSNVLYASIPIGNNLT